MRETDNVIIALSAIFLCSSSVGIWSTQSIAFVIYSLGFLLVVGISLNDYSKSRELRTDWFFLVVLLMLVASSVVNLVASYRVCVLLVIVFFFTPCLSCKRSFEAKVGLLRSLCRIFIFLSIVNFVCYCVGYNGVVEPSNPLDFKGIMVHPMWLSPVCGISVVALLAYVWELKGIRGRLVCLVLACLCLFVCVAAASRSSLLATFIGAFFVFWVKIKNTKLAVRALGVSLLLLVMLFPHMDYRRMEAKQEYQREIGETSRESLWKSRLNEISDSPFLGVGVSVSISSTNERKSGRMESGGGWISVISQSGLLTFCVIVYGVIGALRFNKLTLQRSYNLLLASSVFVFLCVHSAFEGYIYTPGVNLCMLFWLTFGILREYRLQRSVR